MVRQSPLRLISNFFFHSIAVYGNWQTWRELWCQSRRQPWLTLAATVALLWILSFLGLAFLVLHISDRGSLPLPAGIFSLAVDIQASLAITSGASSPGVLAWPWLVGLAWGAGLSWLRGTQKLSTTVAAIYQGNYRQRRGWRARLLMLTLALALLAMVVTVSSLLKHGLFSYPSSRLWQPLARIAGWLVSALLISLTLALLHRLSPKGWLPGCPLWPGVGLTTLGGLSIWGAVQWGLAWLDRQNLANELLLMVNLQVFRLLLLLWLIPVGAQFNLSLLRFGGQKPRPRPKTTPIPPSFDSFKINR
ncbi:MAG: hypothetical protein KGQ93_08520 [Cyanobacteria bacterium REEB459]|nr:hypothetical protein [Cyanobacteria bacterium REEB459]